MGSPGKNTGVGSHSRLQGIFLIQGSDSGLLHCRQILYCLSHREHLTSKRKEQKTPVLPSNYFSYTLALC